MQFERHGASRLQQVRANKVVVDCLMVELYLLCGILYHFYDMVGFNVHPSRPVLYVAEKGILFPSIGENVVHDVRQRGYRTSRSIC